MSVNWFEVNGQPMSLTLALKDKERKKQKEAVQKALHFEERSQKKNQREEELCCKKEEMARRRNGGKRSGQD